MNKDVLKHIIDFAIKQNKGLAIEVTIPDCPSVETIINPPENLEFKKDFYMETYDEDLRHKHNKEIQIVSARSVDVTKDPVK